MRTRRLSALTAGVVALSLVAAACGSDSEGSDADDGDTGGETEESDDGTRYEVDGNCGCVDWNLATFGAIIRIDGCMED